MWLHVFIELFIAYIDSDEFEQGISFGAFAAAQEEFTSLYGLSDSDRSVAQRENELFIEGKRDELRDTLSEAEEAGVSPFDTGTAQLPYFAKAGNRPLRSALWHPLPIDICRLSPSVAIRAKIHIYIGCTAHLATPQLSVRVLCAGAEVCDKDLVKYRETQRVYLHAFGSTFQNPLDLDAM